MKLLKKNRIMNINDNEIINVESNPSTINKNENINLNEIISDNKLNLSVSWETIGNFYSDTYEIEFAAILLDKNNKLIKTDNCVCCIKKELDSIKINDVKSMFINFNKIPEEINKINLYLIIHKAFIKEQTFNDIINLKIMFCYNKKALMNFEIEKNENKKTTLQFGELSKINNNWILNTKAFYKNANISDLLLEFI